MPRDLLKFFNPKSIAVIGASRSPEKVGSVVLRNIIDSGYSGEIYPVNPNVKKIGKLKCYEDIKSMPKNVELAIVSLPAEVSVSLIPELAQHKIKNIVLFAAGFKETGSEGAVLEKKLYDLATEYELNILGPNCLGFVNQSIKLNATFGELIKETGNIKFISQSGAIAASIFDWANSIGLGFSEFITLGNKTVITETDILEYFMNQSENSDFSIGMYLESISDGKKFIQLASELSKRHPIFIIKPGKTHAATAAMQSHTGSLAGEDDVLDAALEKCGVLRCSTMEDFFDTVKAFDWSELPKGNNVAVISNAGGPGVLSADAVVLEGLNLVTFDEPTKNKLTKVLPRISSILNPVDLMGDALAERYGHAAEIIIENSNADSLLFLLTPQIMTQIEKTADYISYLSKKYHKPIFCSFIGGNTVLHGEKILNKNKIPVFKFPERAIKAISTMYRYYEAVSEKKNLEKSPTSLISTSDFAEIKQVLQNALNKNHLSLDNIEADKVINSVDIKTPATEFVKNYDEALSFVKEFNYPVVLKLSAKGLVHKKAFGGVKTNIVNSDQLKLAFEDLENVLKQNALEKSLNVDNDKDLRYLSIQIQQQITEGTEIILGMKHDKVFGNFILFGAGGSFVEIIADKNLLLLPASSREIEKIIKSSKINKILKKENIETDKLVQTINNFCKLSEFVDENIDIEINPLIVTKDDVWAVDTKVVFKKVQ